MISATNARSSISRASCPLRKKRKGGYLLLLALDDDKTRAAPVVKALVFACIAKADDMVVVVVSSSSSSSFVEQSKNDADVYINKRGVGSQIGGTKTKNREDERRRALCSTHSCHTQKKRQRG